MFRQMYSGIGGMGMGGGFVSALPGGAQVRTTP